MKQKIKLFDLLDTPFTASPTALISPFNVGVLTYFLTKRLAPNRNPLWLALMAALNYAIADVTHYMGHIISSRAADAPVDEVHITAPLPMAVYHEQDVSPAAHRARSIGGPIASILIWAGATILKPIGWIIPPLRGFLDMAGLVNLALGLGSLLPLPFIDGGVILKWSLVEQGRTPEEADEMVEDTNLAIGMVSGLLMLSQLVRGKWLKAAIAAMVAVPTFLTGIGKKLR